MTTTTHNGTRSGGLTMTTEAAVTILQSEGWTPSKAGRLWRGPRMPGAGSIDVWDLTDNDGRKIRSIGDLYHAIYSLDGEGGYEG